MLYRFCYLISFNIWTSYLSCFFFSWDTSIFKSNGATHTRFLELWSLCRVKHKIESLPFKGHLLFKDTSNYILPFWVLGFVILFGKNLIYCIFDLMFKPLSFRTLLQTLLYKLYLCLGGLSHLDSWMNWKLIYQIITIFMASIFILLIRDSL